MDPPRTRQSRLKSTNAFLPAVVGALLGSALMVVLAVSVGAVPAATTHPASGASDPPSLAGGPPAPIQIPGSGPEALAGYSVATAPPLVVVGAPGSNVSGLYDAGSVTLVNTTSGATSTLVSPDPTSYAYYGLSVALSGKTLVVGAPGVSQVYLYSLPSLSLTHTVSFTATTSSLFGWSVAMAGTTLVVGAPGDNASVNASAGHVFVYSTTTWLQNLLSSPAPATLGLFGWAVAISGSTIIVGAPQETSMGVQSAGNAYEFAAGTGYLVRTFSSPWPVESPETYLGAQGFGTSVAIVGNMVAIGDPNSSGPEYENPDSSGAVFEYNLATDAETVMTSPNVSAGAYFGQSVSLGSGGTWLAVGSPNASTPLTPMSGVAYLFSTSLGLARSSTFTSPDANSSGLFGFSVAVNGGSVVVGAPTEANRSGNAWVFRGPAMTLTGGMSPLDGEEFGQAVATSGPYVVVGAPAWGVSEGAVFVLNTSSNTELMLTSPIDQDGAYFGFSVAVSDGLIAVGAPGYSPAGYYQVGNVWVFNASTGALVQSVASPEPFVNNTTYFGYSVGLSGSALIVGAPAWAGLQGVAFVCGAFNGSCPTVFQPVLAQIALVGYSVAISGATALVGGPLVNTSGEMPLTLGAAWELHLGATLTVTTLVSPDPQNASEFGASVALDQSEAIVGAPEQNVSGTAGAGEAFVFNLTTGVAVGSLVSPNPQFNGEFGDAVGISGITAVVGAPSESSSSPQEGFVLAGGNVYLFDLQTNTPYLAFPAPNASPDGALGYSVAIAGSTVVVGAPYESSVSGDDSGCAYIL